MIKVFLSYPSTDDRFDAIFSFREHFANELEMREPGSSIFRDKEGILPGSTFETSIRRFLSDADVFVIFLAPAWLGSDWCRMEFEWFTTKEREAGFEPRILPILWVRSGLDDAKDDPIAEAISKLHYEDWTELRHHSWDSPALRERVAALVETTVNLARHNH